MKLFIGYSQIDFIHASEAEDAKNIVQCHESGVVLAAAKWELDVPTSFEWMPGGVHTINAHYGKKGIELTVDVDAQTAKNVQASYERWLVVRPKQTPFGCVEHREEEAAIRLPKDIAAFEWKESPEPGIYCTATPTELGAKNVNGRIHSSWSPSFATDAAYDKAKEIGGRLYFPKGVRGSKENPAKVTGCAFSVGSLTNKPAFRDILPVRAREVEEVLEQDESVKATWSDASREKALEARKAYGKKASFARNAAYAHEASQSAHHNTLLAMDEGTARSHKEAAYAHERAAESHSNAHNNGAGYESHGDAAAEHRSIALHHHEEANRLFKKEKKSVAASETDDNNSAETIYAKLTPAPEDVEAIYAKLAEPENPTQKLYDRLNGVGNGQTADRT